MFSSQSATSQDSFGGDKSGLAARTFSYQESQAPNDDDLPRPSQRRMLQANAPEWKLILVGLIAAAVNGAVFPVYAIIFGEVKMRLQGFSSHANLGGGHSL